MTETAWSVRGVPIRLTDERWTHIMEQHCEMAGLRADVMRAIAEPARVVAGSAGELLAVREVGPGRAIVVVYREEQDDGFVITAFVTSRLRALERRRPLWT